MIDMKSNREKLGLTQKTLADMVGVSVRTVQDWEQKRYLPGKIRLDKLKELFKLEGYN